MAESGSRRDQLEKELEEIEKDFSLGYLTEKGFRKRRSGTLLELLELDYMEGEITEKGFANKKERIVTDTAEKVVPEKGQGIASSLAQCSSTSQSPKMAETIAKLFKTPSGSTGKVTAGKKKKLSISQGSRRLSSKVPPAIVDIKTKVVCMPIDSAVVPTANVQEVLLKAGFIHDLQFKVSDSEDTIRRKIHNLFPQLLPAHLDNSIPQFYFLMARNDKLERARFGFYDGETVMHRLVHLGCIYILPLSLMQDSPMSSSLKKLLEQIQVPPCSSSTGTQNTTIIGSSAPGTQNTTIIGPSVPNTQNTTIIGPSALKCDENQMIAKEVTDPFIGGMILEMAGLMKPIDQEELEQEDGFQSLYAVDPEVMMWLSWRQQSKKPLTKAYAPKQKFVMCTKTELTDFLSFRDALRKLEIGEDYFLPASFLLEVALIETGCTASSTSRFNGKYYRLNTDVLFRVASWVMSKQN